MTDKKEQTPAQKIRHQLSVFQMMMLAGRDEAAIKCLKNLYQIADDLEPRDEHNLQSKTKLG